jgi:H+/gluconate symporter-like permease
MIRAEASMYIDSIVLYGLAIVALTCIMIGYVWVYAYKHIKEDTEKAEQVIKSLK